MASELNSSTGELSAPKPSGKKHGMQTRVTTAIKSICDAMCSGGAASAPQGR